MTARMLFPLTKKVTILLNYYKAEVLGEILISLIHMSIEMDAAKYKSVKL